MSLSLVGLPPELIHVIVNLLISDNRTLKNLCLVGNNTLLEIARPLTWCELTISCDIDSPCGAPHPITRPLLEFAADPAKASAVRSVILDLHGTFDEDADIWTPLLESLKKFTNATHAKILCFELEPDVGDSSWLVCWVVEAMPALANLHVEGCNMDHETVVLQELVILYETLQAIECRYCDGGLHFLWEGTPNVKVLEILSGDGEAYWMQSGSATGDWRGYEEFDINAELALYNQLSNGLVRLGIRGDCDRDKLQPSISSLTDFFIEEEEPFLPCLEELILDVPFALEEYAALITVFAKPTIKLLLLSIGPNDETDIIKIFEIMTLSQRNPFENYQSLKEFWVPLEGTDESLTANLSTLLAAAPEISHIYFGRPRETDRSALLRIAESYASAIHTLQYVSWNDEVTIRIKRDEQGVGRGTLEGFRRPYWTEFRGLGPWWEYN